MAKSGVAEGDEAMAAKSAELKKELQKLARLIADDEDFSPAAIDRAQKVLFALRELKLKKSVRSDCGGMVGVPAPEEFKCPLSKELMRDPVIIASGQTFDRPFIQKWLGSGNRTCPKTQQVLSHTILTPNHLIRDLVSQWCENHGFKLPDPFAPIDDEAPTEADKTHFLSLLEKISSPAPPDRKEAAKELRLLTKKSPPFRALFGESPDSIPKLLSPLLGPNARATGPALREDVVTTLLNLSIHDSNKKLVAENPDAVPLLVESLKPENTIETRANSSAALFTLSALDPNKVLIGRSGAFGPLIGLLDEGHPLAVRDVASAIFNLCIVHENKSRAVKCGAVRVIMRKIMDGVHVDELLSIVAMLSTSQRAIEEIVELGGVSCLLGIIQESSCARNKENCVAILYAICYGDRSQLREIREEEKRRGTISWLAQNGTSRARRKASGILERMNRVFDVTHTA
ncbi:U-box domain-containing protein 9 [Striga hermonthica]|uniref:RING-type E3 ubiquitin transferase n=1 Tax=Striga hermonthica TaxID=68872 RepID=A0A9N7P0P0_STRHE|nr:U-box domain-containing protein 9 [Striga hermonthica]